MPDESDQTVVYSLSAPGEAETFVDNEGNEVTALSSRWFTDPCQVVSFFIAEQANGHNFTEEDRGTYKAAKKECDQQQAGEPAVVTPLPGTVGEGDGPPAEPDTPDQQAAPEVDVFWRLKAWGSQRDVTRLPPVDLTQQQHDPVDPAEALDRLAAAQPIPIEDEETLRQRWRRNDPDPGEPHPTHSGPASRTPGYGGDPVDLFRGVLTITAVDLDLPTPTLPLRLVRTYLSGRPYFGPWGFGWDHNFNVYLRELNDGGVALWTGAQREDLFRATGAGFEPDHGVHERLEAVPGPPHTYLLTRRGGATLRFERPAGWTDAERIPLAELADRHGNRQTLSYDPANRLALVQADTGQSLTFHYGGCGLLETVDDSTGRTVHYDHHPEIEHLVRVVGVPTEPYPDGPTTCYEYDWRHDHPAMRHNLLRVVDAEGRTYLENEYAGPDAGWAFNRVVAQRYADHVYELAYESIQYVPESPVFLDAPFSRTVVRNPDGSVQTHTFNYRGDMLDRRFRLCADGSYRVVAEQRGYDEAGNTTLVVGPGGGRTMLTYDAANPDPCARGNLLKVELGAPPGFPLPSRIVLQTSYDDRYQLPVETLDERLATTRFTYDFDVAPGDPGSTGRLVRVDLPDTVDPDGNVQQAHGEIESNGRGQVTAATSPEGVRDETEHFAGGPFDGFVQHEVHDASGVGLGTEFAYDGRGYVAQVTAPGGAVTGLAYDSAGQLVEVTLPAAAGQTATLRFAYDADGEVRETASPRGTYDDDVITDDHIIDRIERDALGYAVRLTEGANTAQPRVTHYCVDHEGRAVHETDPAGVETVRHFDERGLLLSETVAAGAPEELTTTFAYDRAGRLVRATEPGGTTTKYEHDPWGRLRHIHLPTGAKLTLSWSACDELIEVTAEGHPGNGGPPRLLGRRGYDYDDRGRLIRQTVASFSDDPTAAVDLVTEYFHDTDDRLRRVRTARGGVHLRDCDGLDRPVRVEDPHGNVEEYLYAPDGDLAQVVRHEVGPDDTRTFAWSMTRDERGRLREVVDPGGALTTYEHDDRDLVVASQEPLGVVTTASYGLLGELLEEVLDPGGLAIVSRWGHDLLGNITSYTDPTGEVTTWERDAHGRVRLTALADGGQWLSTYGPNGEVATETMPSGTTVSHTYDPATGQLDHVDYVPSPGVLPVPTHKMGYDALGRLVRAEIPGSVVTRAYDSLDRIVHETLSGKSMQWLVDDLAGTVDLVYPDGRRQRSETDLLGRVTRVSLQTPGALGGIPGATLAELRYAGPERLHDVLLANGVRTAFAYDDAGRALRVDHLLGATTLAASRYRYDLRDRRRLVQHQPGDTIVYDFDARDRLDTSRAGVAIGALADVQTQADQDADVAVAEAAAANVPATSYVLDAADSRLGVTETDGTTVGYTYGTGHQLAAAGSETVAHHADGTRVADGPRGYDVDALGRVVRVSDAASSTVLAEIGYDALGRQASLTADGATVNRWFAGDAWAHGELAGSGIVVGQRSPHPLWPTPLLSLTPDGTWFPHPDGRFDVRVLTDDAGSVAARLDYATFGMPEAFAADGTTPLDVASLPVPPTFGGMEHLTATGLYVTEPRLYDPAHGVFLARDPLLYEGGPSPYLYARHNPADLVDPDGRLPILVVVYGLVKLAAAGAAIGAAYSAVREGIASTEANRAFKFGAIAEGAVWGAGGAVAVFFAPEVAGATFLVMGAWSGASELAQGHYATAAFDFVGAGLGARHGWRSARASAHDLPLPSRGLAPLELWGPINWWRGDVRIPKGPGGAAPEVVHYTSPLNLKRIGARGVVQGRTEGRVYGLRPPAPGKRPPGTFKVGRKLGPSRVRFTGEAAQRFKPHPIQGFFSARKRFHGNEHVSRKVAADLRLGGHTQKRGKWISTPRASYQPQTGARRWLSWSRHGGRLVVDVGPTAAVPLLIWAISDPEERMQEWDAIESGYDRLSDHWTDWSLKLSLKK